MQNTVIEFSIGFADGIKLIKHARYLNLQLHRKSYHLFAKWHVTSVFNKWCNLHTSIWHTDKKKHGGIDIYRNILSTYTACGQKWFRFRHLPYIFHIKPFIFITFSWSHSLSDFHEIFSIKCRNKYSFFFVSFANNFISTFS